MTRQIDRPDLQALVATFGSYANVPAWAWEEWDARCELWDTQRRSNLLGSVTWKLMSAWKAKKARSNRRRK